MTVDTSVMVNGQDWDDTYRRIVDGGTDRLVVNFGPQHPSTHGVLRLILTLDGETVTDARIGVGYLHTGIEKSTEFRTWTQAVPFVTRADYLAPLFNEAAYCLSVERLLGVEAPPRAQDLRVLVMELNRISSHIIALAMSGLELGYGYTITLNGWREVEKVRDILETITGLRMNHAYIRPGGVVQDIPPGTDAAIRGLLKILPAALAEYRALTSHTPLWKLRTRGVGVLELPSCMAYGVTGPPLRAAGLPWDLRRTQPYSGYERYDFAVPTRTGADTYDRWETRIDEIAESAKIIEQCLDGLRTGPIMVDDPKIGWPARLAIGADGLGNAPDHIAHIMGTSMEALIHHFKRHRGLPRPARPGLRAHRVAARRTGRPRGQRGRLPPPPRPPARPQPPPPPGPAVDDRGRPGGRPGPHPGRPRHHHGRHRPLTCPDREFLRRDVSNRWWGVRVGGEGPEGPARRGGRSAP